MLKLPIAQSRFRKLRESGYLYVDKTKYAHEMITSGEQYYFLSRPRRFGKSLLVSTLQEILAGNRTLFTDLAIDKTNYNWLVHGVIKLDFSTIGADNIIDFKRNLCELLAVIIDSYSLNVVIDFSSPEIALGRLVRALHKKFGSVAILIDEYDDPITQLLTKPDQAGEIRDVMQRFFKNIKSLEDYLNFVFITGVSAFSRAGLFSGINNLQMITLDPRYGNICGYTEHEIDDYFGVYLQAWADSAACSIDVLRQELKDWYNGYLFNESALAVYNPYSFTNALHKQKLDNFWIETGNPRFLIEELKKASRKSELQLLQPEQMEVSKYTLGIFDIDQIPLPALMFQTGYLTIGSYDLQTKLFKLNYPNLEVKSTLEKYLLTIFADTDLSQTNNMVTKFKAALNTQDLNSAMIYLQLILAKIPYQIHIKIESFYHSLLVIICNAAEIKTQAEYATSHGRIDLVLDLPKVLYIVELKFNQSAELALAQIETQRYYESFLDVQKSIVLLGINFNKTAGDFNLSYASKVLK